MKPLVVAIVLLSFSVSCRGKYEMKNDTRPGGYALGERISLKFSLSGIGEFPDSISVRVLERKTGYTYLARAGRGECNDICRYECIWDGRKPDGSWPAGGRYLVYAFADANGTVYSDTVLVGLAD
jgi:hypothetical protein